MIIKATENHLEDLNRLFDTYRRFYKAESNLNASYQFLSDRMERDESTVFIAYVGQIAAGFTQIYPMFSSVSMQTVYVLNDLYVDPQYRNKGIGEALLNRGKDYAIEHKAKALILETDSDNPAQKLYEKLGWQRDTQFHYTWKVKLPK